MSTPLPFFIFIFSDTESNLTGDLTISLDAMGGDAAPEMVVVGAARALTRGRNMRFLFCGDEAQIRPLLDKFPKLAKRSEIIHTTDVIPSDMKPSVALRQGRHSSMRLAVQAVAEGRADAVLSAGNTGALMATAKVVLRTLPGVTRPAIASVFPTLEKGKGTVVLDLGANLESSARSLVEFAILGSVYARDIMGVSKPKVALLNVGSEEMKGHGTIREAAQILTEHLSNAEYMGFAEGTDLNRGLADVIVTDGFTGNVALKTSEGTAKLIAQMMRESIRSTPLSYIGLPFVLLALKKLKARIDPRLYNGGMFMGLKGLCVKSHGGTDEVGFANAIKVAHGLAENRFNERVAEALEKIDIEHIIAVREEVA